MSQPSPCLPLSELELRWAKARRALAERAPEAGGLLVFSRMHVFWFSGTLAMGAFWLPLTGEPLLLCRKGLERARLESAAPRQAAYRSFKDLPGLAAAAGSPLPEVVAVEMAGLTWEMGGMLSARLPQVRFVAGDAALARAQAVKTPYEMEILRRCGAAHHASLHDVLPGRIRPGMTERDIAHAAWAVFFEHGHMGHMRMQNFGEEIFLGHVSAGESGNYPSAFNGPLGLVGEHPAVPMMGSAARVWEPGQVLACDIGFSLEGYCTDKTQLYFAGPASALPAEVRRAQDFCMAVQARAAEMLRPGRTPAAIWAEALRMSDAAGMNEGFMGLGGNKVPFLGHGIGLAIDTWPPLARGFDEPLEPGMAFALEPKQGIPGRGMVGVENTFEVTASGGVCLTGDHYDILCLG
ncbi:MAG: M24 family metallopeptidase [Desulfovibrionaceae bacterium]